jgi:hypothetical protein
MRTPSLRSRAATALAAAAVAGMCRYSSAAPAGALITSLPGLEVLPPFKMYSGYITTRPQAGANIFYWFVESAGNPATDPMLLWNTGGPGCSSLYALMTEHGPFRIDATNGSQLVANPYAWNANANVVRSWKPDRA